MNWIKQFAEKLYPINREKRDIEGAFILKNNNIPKSIFKYREVNVNSIKNLEDNTVWLADPNNFNDPYDCTHTVNFNSLSKYRGAETLNNFLSDRGKNITLDEETKNSFLQSEDPMNALIDHLLKEVPQDKIDDIKNALFGAQEKMHEDLSKENSKAFSSRFKLCSFSERNDSMLMWAHYADYHEGFCIEYDMENIPYSDARRRFLYPTIYSENIFDATEHFKTDINDKSFNNLYLSMAAIVKAIDWNYEREWRLVFTSDIIKKEQAYVMGKPKSICLGTKISATNQNILVKLCEKQDIPIFKMKTHHDKFKLKETELKNTEQHFFKKDA